MWNNPDRATASRVLGISEMRLTMDKYRALFLILVLTLTSLGMTGQADAMSAPRLAAGNGCTYYIPENVLVVDGRKNYRYVQPGDTLCIPAGERDNLKLMYLQGEPGKPITVRNTGGIVTIGGNTYLSGGLGIYSSAFLRVTGTGESAQCGAQYSAAEQKCGIVISNTHKGIKISTSKDVELLHDVEIDHVAVTDTSTEIKTRGINIHPEPGQLISGIYIHHNYVARTLAEGIYMGTEPHGRPFEVLGKIKNLEVSYNLVEETGYDGIKVKVAIENVKVHHNLVRNAGQSNTPAHQGGIKIAMTNGQFYNNYVENVFEGIRSGRPLDMMTEARYFNNVVVNARSVGIEAVEEGALIFNNTVISCGEAGIVTKATTGMVFDNIVAGCKGDAVKARLGEDGVRQKFNNLIGPIDSIGFIDPASGNFNLRPDSIAIEAGEIWPDPLSYDFNHNPRPAGKRPDVGAFEYSFGGGK
jgi:hypothetical protein